jgi:hypothetical protein
LISSLRVDFEKIGDFQANFFHRDGTQCLSQDRDSRHLLRAIWGQSFLFSPIAAPVVEASV